MQGTLIFVFPFIFPHRIHGIAISDDQHYFHTHVTETLKSIGLEDVKSQDILHIVEGYKGRGYGLNTQEELGMFHGIIITLRRQMCADMPQTRIYIYFRRIC